MTWRWWEELTTAEFAALDPRWTVAILPLAAIEQHGPHLPLGTDAILCDGVLAAALESLSGVGPVLRLPTQRIGLSTEHTGFAGTLTAADAALLAVWNDIGRSVARSGVRKLIVFNTHGGQPALVDLLAQRLRHDERLLVARANLFAFGIPADVITEREKKYGLHGGQIETSLMLRIAPHLVRRELLADFRSRAEDIDGACGTLEVAGATGLAWQAEDLNVAGAVGNAAAGSAALGERLLQYAAKRLATIIDDVQRLTDWPPSAAETPRPQRH